MPNTMLPAPSAMLEMLPLYKPIIASEKSAPKTTGNIITSGTRLWRKKKNVKASRHIIVMLSVSMVSFFNCRALLTPTIGPPKNNTLLDD